MNNKKEHFLLSQLDKTLCTVTSDESAIYIEYINDHKSDEYEFNNKEILVGQYLLSQSTLKSYLKKLTKAGIELPIKIKLPIKSGTPKRKKRNNLIKFSTEYLQATPLYVNDDDSELKNFQIKGVDWLVGNKIGILADDMGLGKTVQSIFALKKLYKQGSINNHILITNYEQLRNTNSIIETLNFDVLIADEAHKIRKLSSGLTKGVQKINRTYFWGLTGTPVENNPQDLVTLLNHVDPLKFSKLKEETDLIFLRDRARPYVLRRTKKDMLKELPEVFEKKEEISLTSTQQKKYDQIWNERMHISNEKGSYFATLNMLRDVCDHFEGSSSKAEKAYEIIKQNIQKDEKTIVFSYYKSVLKILEDILVNKSIEFTTIYGSDTNEERTSNLNKFKSKSNIPVILLSARIAGEGLTITEANNVIFLNEWWNPSNNNQAKDRVIRIGQERNVNITTFYAKGTIEERLKKILETKTELYENLIDGLVDNEALGKTLLQN